MIMNFIDDKIEAQVKESLESVVGIFEGMCLSVQRVHNTCEAELSSQMFELMDCPWMIMPLFRISLTVAAKMVSGARNTHPCHSHYLKHPPCSTECPDCTPLDMLKKSPIATETLAVFTQVTTPKLI